MGKLVLTVLNWIIICLFIVICCAVGEKIEYRRENPNYKRINRFKHLQQLGIYVLEIMGVCGILLIIAQWRYPVDASNAGSFWDEQFSRFVNMYAVYQIFIFVVLNIVQSAKVDMWLSLETLAKYGLHYLDTVRRDNLEVFERYLRQLRDPGCFMTEKGLEIASKIEKQVRCDEIDAMELTEIQIRAQKEHDELFWHFSLLLNLVK